MKLIKTLNPANSAYSGKQKNFTELTMRPSPKTDENGNPLSMNQRYYTLRFLSFEHGDRTDYPFIMRHEHIKYNMDANGKCTGVEKITCPTTEWAKNRLAKQGEPIGKGYCPICQYSFDKNKEAFAVKGQRDNTAARLAKETEKKWAVYMPVYVVNDPHYNKNNQHLRTLRLTDKEGFNKIVESLEYLMNEKGLNVFNGEEGVNLAILVEKVSKNLTDKNGNPIINKSTGKPYVRSENKITDIKASTKNLVAYPQITDKAIEELDFDGTYNVASNRAALTTFLNSNWLAFGASEDDFESVESAPPKATDDEWDTPSVPVNKHIEQTETVDEHNDANDTITAEAQPSFQSTDDMVMSIIGAKPAVANSSTNQTSATVKPMTMPINTEEVREEATNNAAFDDLPF